MFEYGIAQEKSTQRAHVCFNIGIVYVYKTCVCIELVQRGSYRHVQGFQPGVDYATSKGFLVPPDDIQGIRRVKIPDKLAEKYPIFESQSTTEKGENAVEICMTLMRNGLFPFFVSPFEVTDHQMQVNGTDILVKGNHLVQVKCDMRGGEGGTGNLFIQTHEVNPLKRH